MWLVESWPTMYTQQLREHWHTLCSLYIDEHKTYLDEIHGDSPRLFKKMIAILLDAKNVVMLSKLGACLQRT